MRLFNIVDFCRLQRQQWHAAAEVSDLQNIKLQRLILHAYRNVPYYRRLLDSAKISPQDINTTDDLRKIPFTSRERLISLPPGEKITRGVDPKKCRRSVTSGTTGLPLETYFSPRDATLMNLSWIRAFCAAGMKPWHKTVAFIGRKQIKREKSWYEHFGFFRRREISAWNRPEDWIAEIIKWQPEVLIGYVMTLKLLAEAIRKYGVTNWRPKHIFHSSAILDDLSRRNLESVFRSPITDIYGSDEGGCIAWECKKCSGYHVCSDMVIVEILRNGEPVSPGEEGEVVITNLHSYALPLIRYRQEDVVRLSSQKPVCGRNFPLLKNVQGRTDDFIVLRNGRKLSPHPVYHSLDPVRGIKRWRVTQESMDMLIVEIEPGGEFNDTARAAIERNLRELTGGEIGINIILRDSIPVNPSAKYRAVSSKIRGS